MAKIKDKDGKLLDYRTNNTGAILKKGKREVYLIFKSVNQGQKARKTIAENSFNKIFNKGRKIKTLGSNVSYIKF